MKVGLSYRRLLVGLSRSVLARDAGKCLEIVDDVCDSGMDKHTLGRILLCVTQAGLIDRIIELSVETDLRKRGS